MCDELFFVTSFTIELREKLGEVVVHRLNSYFFVVIFFIITHSFRCLLASSTGLYV